MSNKITDYKKSPELTSSGNFAIVPNSPPDTDPMRQLIERWLTSCKAVGRILLSLKQLLSANFIPVKTGATIAISATPTYSLTLAGQITIQEEREAV